MHYLQFYPAFLTTLNSSMKELLQVKGIKVGGDSIRNNKPGDSGVVKSQISPAGCLNTAFFRIEPDREPARDGAEASPSSSSSK